MNLEKAIEIQEDWVCRETIVNADDFMDAQWLLIEAGKIIVLARMGAPANLSLLLPGETKD